MDATNLQEQLDHARERLRSACQRQLLAAEQFDLKQVERLGDIILLEANSIHHLYKKIELLEAQT